MKCVVIVSLVIHAADVCRVQIIIPLYLIYQQISSLYDKTIQQWPFQPALSSRSTERGKTSKTGFFPLIGPFPFLSPPELTTVTEKRLCVVCEDVSRRRRLPSNRVTDHYGVVTNDV